MGGVVKVKLLEGAVMPTKQRDGDAGFDLIAHSISQSTEDFIEYGTGVHIEIPKDCVGLLFPRSSISNMNMILANSVGVIDSNFRGEIKLRFRTTGGKIYTVGDRVGQLVILKLPDVQLSLVSSLEETERGENGFGSSGR